MTLPVVGIAMAATFAVAGPMKPVGDGELKKSVERLIGDLESTSRGVRVRAERELVALGPRILPWLPPSELTPNVSVREAVRRVRIRLETAAARESVKPSRIALKGTPTLKDALREIAKQSGNRIDTAKLPPESLAAKIDVSYAGTTFWTVLDDLARRGKLRFRVVPGENRIAVEPRPADSSKPVAVDNGGAFRIAVLSLKKRPIVGDDANELLRVRWSIAAEPRLRPLFLKYGGRSLLAETAAGKLDACLPAHPSRAGKALSPFDADANLEVAAVDGAAPISQSSDFILPKGVAAEAIRFRGQVRMLTAARSEPVKFPNLARAKGSAKRRGGVTVTVNDVSAVPMKANGKKAASQRVSVDVSVSYDVGGPAFESHRTWMFHNRVYLETAAGKRIPADPAFKTIVQRDGAVGVGYRFTLVPKLQLGNEPAAKLQFVYVAPTLLIDVPVRFDFAKLSLTP
jgi:hypothetical protein